MFLGIQSHDLEERIKLSIPDPFPRKSPAKPVEEDQGERPEIVEVTRPAVLLGDLANYMLGQAYKPVREVALTGAIA